MGLIKIGTEIAHTHTHTHTHTETQALINSSRALCAASRSAVQESMMQRRERAARSRQDGIAAPLGVVVSSRADYPHLADQARRMAALGINQVVFSDPALAQAFADRLEALRLSLRMPS